MGGLVRQKTVFEKQLDQIKGKMGLIGSPLRFNLVDEVANLGSDPNSTKDGWFGWQTHPELGSDPHGTTLSARDKQSDWADQIF